KAVGDDERTKSINDLDLRGTSVLLPDVQVIAMGDTALAAPTPEKGEKESEEESDQPSFLVTVAVSPEDAPRLAHGITEYELYAGLRGADVKIDQGSKANDVTIFDQDIRDLLKESS